MCAIYFEQDSWRVLANERSAVNATARSPITPAGSAGLPSADALSKRAAACRGALVDNRASCSLQGTRLCAAAGRGKKESPPALWYVPGPHCGHAAIARQPRPLAQAIMHLQRTCSAQVPAPASAPPKRPTLMTSRRTRRAPACLPPAVDPPRCFCLSMPLSV
jgi:hypothetical protein